MTSSQSSIAAESGEFVITRVFDAPRDLVWKAWTEAPRLAEWWGPKGCSVRVMKLDVRPGGIFHYSMQFKADQPPWWGRFVYREIMPPERLAYVSSFSDENAGVTRAPFKGHFPLEIYNTLTLEEHGGKTTLTLRTKPVEASDEEHAEFISMFRSMQQGFTGTFDQLEAFLQKR